ncbi:MAG TPA: alpha-ketoglutarate-dependent dioxygenase AlkB [Gemmatimonadales bacterium]|nr:alpha-ketoglutarate-dependent dioxygenase AlkB [Gemmatimonadales bacterium]
MSSKTQLDAFGQAAAFPEGFQYRPAVISPEEEQALVQRISTLPFKAFEFRGFEGKRRTVSYGWRYDFNVQKLQQADPIPPFLIPVRAIGARFAGLAPEALEQVTVIEYSPGSPIGWHKDRPMFGDVVGVSLVSPTRFRFRRKAGAGWERAALTVEPRSIYLLRGPARDEWEHSIPPVETLRYSITMRTLRER